MGKQIPFSAIESNSMGQGRSGSSSHILCECPTAGSIISFSGPPEKRKWENKDVMLESGTSFNASKLSY